MSYARFDVVNADCLDALRNIPDCSVDAIVTDPPYGLSQHSSADIQKALTSWLAGDEYKHGKAGFMGKSWDSFVPSPSVWRECFRVLKPGGYILAFAGSRTQDLMSVALRLAGFECRDTVMWVYGSGFPKSVDVSKAIDKAAGAEREVIGQDRKARSTTGASALPTMGGETVYQSWDITAPATDAARQWQGWGTALKPAYEPVLLFRKPLTGTVAENVLEHGTGGLNIDGCRIGTESTKRPTGSNPMPASAGWNQHSMANVMGGSESGRWPANFIHDGSEEVLALFPHTVSGGGNGVRAELPNTCMSGKNYARVTIDGQPPSSGSAARFFYCAKASKRDRDEGLAHIKARHPAEKTGRKEGGVGLVGDADNRGQTANPYANGGAVARNHHPTVKPTDLMRYLCRLITPPDGVILDPFMGSGSTGKAAMLEGFRFIGIEQSPEYFAIARTRIANAIRDNFS